MAMQGMATLGPFDALAEGIRLQWHGAQPVGPDFRMLARVVGRDVF